MKVASPRAPLTATYVGGAACAQCHREIAQRWRGSHHDLAMQPPNDSSVLGDFRDVQFRYAGITSSFFRQNGKFIVRTDGPDGALRDYDVKYTFGADPLQQYLVDIGGGRIQALGVAWDTRPRTQGGQRWFHLYEGQRVTHRDDLHWTGPRQNWNYMCAECHSTGVRKNYDADRRQFSTSFAEVNVGCEACHGPGSAHVAWASRSPGWRRVDSLTKGLPIRLEARRHRAWTIDRQTGNAVSTVDPGARREVESCARCHARRDVFTDNYVEGRPLGDAHRVALLDDPLYYADGQIRDEVYEYGSFVQSKMFQRGVRCSDCHDPHSAQLRAPGSETCRQCHAAEKYENATHHFHQIGSRGADCIGCHMPARTYMRVDVRHDHSFRIPRPDLTVALGVPNACTQCHATGDAKWAVRQLTAWYGHVPSGYQRYAEALAGAAATSPQSGERLLAVISDSTQPAIARATALARVGPGWTSDLVPLVRRTTKDSDPLVRRAAVTTLAFSPGALRLELLAGLLGDSVRAVRMEAARALATTPIELLTLEQQTSLERALAEYIAGERFNADRPEAHTNLALLYSAQRRLPDAESELRTALELDPRFVPALVNLADIYRATGRDAEGERVLRDALTLDPGNAATHHALGLWLVRQKRLAAALTELARAASTAPHVARYQYVYAVALHENGQPERAKGILAGVLSRHPADREALFTYASYARAPGDFRFALQYARRLADSEPANTTLQQLVQRLESAVSR